MLIFIPFFNLLFTFAVVMIAGAGHGLARAHPHPNSDFPHRNRSITDSPLLRRVDLCDGLWAGAIWDNSPTGGWNEVSAYLNAPQAINSGVSAFVWVGIDGNSCNDNAYFQVGIQAFLVPGSTSTHYYVFAQWSQDFYLFSNFPVESGDILVVTAIAHSVTSGTATVQSISKNVTVSHTFTSTDKLLFATAEWIVQPTLDGSDTVVFGAVGFYNAQATKFDGTAVNGAGANVHVGSATSVTADVYGGISVYFNLS